MAIPEVQTIVISGTWATDDTCYLEINGKQLVLTIGAAVTIDDVGAALVAMVNGNTAVGTETRSAIGSEVGEFGLVTASYDTSSDTLSLTGQSNGRPIGTVTRGETTAGNGALGAVSVATSGTGPNDWDNVDNWSADTAPVNSDTVVFDHQATSAVMFNISKTSLTVAVLTITSGFRYSIGLPEVNGDSANLPYDEHLTTFLSLAAGSVMNIDGSGSGGIKIDLAATDTVTTVTGSNGSMDSGAPAVQLNINNSSADLHVLGGVVGLCTIVGTTGRVDVFTCGGSDNSRLTVGSSVTVDNCTISSGKVTLGSAIVTANVDGGELTQVGSGTITTLNINNKGVFWDISSGTISAVYMTGGRYDRSKDNRSKTISNFTAYSRASIKDPVGAAITVLDIYPALKDMTLDLPTRRTYTITTI